MCNTQIRTKPSRYHRQKRLDFCLIDEIRHINHIESYWKTIASCCGHGIYDPTIIVRSYDNSECMEWYSQKQLRNKCKNGKLRKNFYTLDKNTGLYFVPELVKDTK